MGMSVRLFLRGQWQQIISSEKDMLVISVWVSIILFLLVMFFCFYFSLTFTTKKWYITKTSHILTFCNHFLSTV